MVVAVFRHWSRY